MTYIRDVQPLRTVPKLIEAETYNTVRLALRRLGTPLVIQPRGLRAVEMLLEPQRWVCVDDLGNGLPLLEWTEFAVTDRALHEPVACRLRLYHVHAGLLLSAVLDNTCLVLAQRLREWMPNDTACG